MAKQEKEEVIFEVKLEPQDAFTDLEKFKKSIVLTKQEIKQLEQAYKKGNITLDEYIKDTARLEASLKTQTNQYNTLQKSVTGVKTQMDKLIDSNKKISADLKKTQQSFQDVAGQINIAGTNVGALTTRLASFANPATAVVGIVGALASAYAKSTIGAKDLEFAQNQLAAATSLVTNRFAELVSSQEEGDGLFARFTSGILFGLSPELAVQSRLIASLKEKAEDLGRAEIETRSKVSDRLADNQEKLTQIADEQTSYNDKLRLSNEITDNLKKNQEDLKTVLGDQLDIIQSQLAFDKNNDQLLTLKLQKEREINKLVADTEKKIQAQVRATENLVAAQRKQSGEDFTALGAIGKAGAIDTGGTKTSDTTGDTITNSVNAQIDSRKALNAALAQLDQQRLDNERERAEQEVRIQQAADSAKLQSAAILAGGIAGILQEGTDLQKFFALIGIGIDTAQAISSLTAASEANPANAVTFGAAGALQFATGLVRILANIALATQYVNGGRAAGGGDFLTKGPTMLMVGDNPGGVERVTVEPISGKGKTVVNPNSNLVQMAGGGSLTAFNDGGLSVNSMTSQVNQSIVTANAIKKMPTPVLDVVETTRVQNRIRTRERLI